MKNFIIGFGVGAIMILAVGGFVGLFVFIGQTYGVDKAMGLMALAGCTLIGFIFTINN